MRPALLTLTVTVGGAVAMTCFALVPGLQVEAHDLTLLISLETFIALTGGFLAYIFWARYRMTGRPVELATAIGLVMLFLRNLLLLVLPEGLKADDPIVTWVPFVVGIIGVGLFAGAQLALAIATPIVRTSLSVVALAGVIGVVADAWVLAPGGFATRDPVQQVPGGPGSYAAFVAVALLFAVAAIALTATADVRSSTFLAWMGAGSVLSAYAAGAYVAFANPLEAVATGDVFRSAAYLLWAVAAVVETMLWARRAREAAAMEERRRVARDLHDGLTQELAYLASGTRALARDHTEPRIEHLARAAERALDDARRALHNLTRATNEPLAQAIATEVEQVARRYGARTNLTLTPGVTVSDEVKETLVRIAREATLNAARHAGVDTVTVTLAHDRDSIRLTVSDEGGGFDPDATGSGSDAGFGVVSMRERAVASGGSLTITSGPGQGTCVAAVFPARDAHRPASRP